MTTPNADHLPFIDLNHQSVISRRDGRWGPHDWTQWPQWYFEEYEHFPFIRRRPAAEKMADHPFHRLWWNMGQDDFVEEPGCGLTGVGRLRESIAEEYVRLCGDLLGLVRDCSSGTKDHQRRLRAAVTAVRHCTATLRWTPQTYANVLYTLTATQRHYLESQAMLKRIQVHEERATRPTDVSPAPPPVDLSFMGTITDLESVASDLFDIGVPVWFVRGGAFIPQHINIVRQEPLVSPHPVLGVVMDRWPGASVFYSGPLSPAIYFATGKWRPGTIDLSRVGPEALPPVREAPPPTSTTIRPASSTPSLEMGNLQAPRTSGPRSVSITARHGKCLLSLVHKFATHKHFEFRCSRVQED